MAFKTDIEIAQETVMEPITEIAKTAGWTTRIYNGCDLYKT